MALGFVRAGFGAAREFFVLDQAKRRSSELTVSQRGLAGPHFQAATRRFGVAQELRQSASVEALVLLREATLQYAAGVVASIDSGSEPADGATADAPRQGDTLEQLDRVIEAGRFQPPAEFAAVRRAIASSDLLAFDRLTLLDASRLFDDMEAVSRWLASLVEVRSQRDLKWVRVRRLLTLSGGVVALLAGIVAWIMVPKNLALKKPVGATTSAYNTKPEGAVDGEHTGTFGYHSEENDSPYLVVDLERPSKIARVKVFGRGDCCYEQSIPLALEVSDDGSKFRKLAERVTSFSESEPWEVNVGPLVTRYVRLRSLHHGVLVLSEFEVYNR